MGRIACRSMSDGGFWSRFVEHRGQIEALLLDESTMRAAFDLVERLLAESGYDEAFDLTIDDDERCVLIFSPEGDRDLARRIDQLLSLAPSLPTWRFFGRRQRRGAAQAVVFLRRIHEVDVQGARFSLSRSQAGLTVFASGAELDGLSERDVEIVVSTLLWHAVGEETVMSLRLAFRKGGGTERLTLEELETAVLGEKVKAKV